MYYNPDKIKPRKDLLIVQRIKEKANKIILPEKYKEYSIIAKVLKVADNIKDIKEGDYIILQELTGTRIPTKDNEDTFFVPYEDVLAVIDEYKKTFYVRQPEEEMELEEKTVGLYKTKKD